MVPNSCCYNRFDLEFDTILQSYELTYLFMNPHGVVGQVPLLWTSLYPLKLKGKVSKTDASIVADHYYAISYHFPIKF